ncbi:hypothetical protein FO440_03055 [Mucilaginibacter corticis]|uniref:Organic solvent tolerance-like N-terminal domain-containing protein n=1 Tax=Mucilaginibacter corticis TaxID=2597670 RepID=A0A556MTH9_9SPHI|nr:OstA-like protein [Mucilaginibacter corticis]TSJ43185.1 hypothetical protein FO440_03055 [Mucilaginibacter corticis]
MNKYVLSLLFLLVTVSVWGQSKSKVNLISSTTMESMPGADGKRIIKVHNGVFKQDYSTLTSDSAYFYPDLNMVDAFSHVVINQGDTVHIYSDKLNYNGNTKIAILTNHVIMVDKDATLTTDNFTYNTATRIGIYTDGGKLVNKGNTLTSTNGYYFAFTRDAYFKYDVICTTPDAVIKTDTMRYNSGTRISYFYGPTIILGKDKDNLYTENGTYNTVTEQAFFGKRNLYTQLTKTLRGDSLFYDRLKGYGKAVKHVTFNDSEQKITLKGDLGEYFKKNELAVVTQNAYMIFVTEDSTATKAGAKKVDTVAEIKKQALTGADSLNKKLTAINKGKSKDQQLTLKGVTDSVTKQLPAAAKQLPAIANQADALKNNVSVKGITDSLIKQMAPPKVVKTPQPAISQSGKPKVVAKAKPAANAHVPVNVPARTPPPPILFDKVVYRFADTLKQIEKPRPNIHYDSLFLVADTLKTQIITNKDLKILKQKQYDATHVDTSTKVVKKAAPIVYTKSPKFIEYEPMQLPVDTSFYHRDYFGKPDPPKPKVLSKAEKATLLKKQVADSLKQKRLDSLALHAPKGLSDTARIRIVNAYNNAKIYKSDLQAKADSMFYASSDSTIRMYTNPMIWTQSSQLSGDTVNLQMKNRKLDNLDMYPSAFIVNIEKNDSTVFNQAGGKRMHGTFKNGKLNTFVIIGNAETIYFKRDTVKNVVTDMSRTLSGKAYFTFDKGEIASNAFVEKYEAKGLPIAKVKEDNKILKGFIWKPKDRPVSKASILSSYNRKKALKSKNSAATDKSGKPLSKKPGGVGTGKDSTGGGSGHAHVEKDTTGNIKADKDTTVKGKPHDIKLNKDTATNKPATLNLKRDTLTKPLPVIKTGKDSLAVPPPNLKLKKDSVAKDTSAIKKSIILKPK